MPLSGSFGKIIARDEANQLRMIVSALKELKSTGISQIEKVNRLIGELVIPLEQDYFQSLVTIARQELAFLMEAE